MERKKEKRARDEEYIDWQIAATKAVFCLRKYRETSHKYWLELVESHLASANSYLQEFDRISANIADPSDYLSAERDRNSVPVPSDRTDAVLVRV